MMPVVGCESRVCCVRVWITCLFYDLLVLIVASIPDHVSTNSVVTLAAFHFFTL